MLPPCLQTVSGGCRARYCAAAEDAVKNVGPGAEPRVPDDKLAQK